MRKHNSWEPILKALKTPSTYRMVAAQIHLTEKRTSAIMLEMFKLNLIHIVGYTRHHPYGSHAPIFLVGKGVSVSKPKPMSSAERAKKYRKNLTSIQIESINMRRRKPKRDIAASWL